VEQGRCRGCASVSRPQSDAVDSACPEAGPLLLKRVAGTEGDRVCRQEGVVRINGEIAATVTQKNLEDPATPRWEGCVTLSATQVFLLGDSPRSFDGRYFGVTQSFGVIGRMSPLLTW
jgi:type IV secretory pathway protease TraF